MGFWREANLGQLFILPEPHFPHLANEVVSPYFEEVLRRLEYCTHSPQCSAWHCVRKKIRLLSITFYTFKDKEVTFYSF